jgi:nucleoid DNA-binding protein
MGSRPSGSVSVGYPGLVMKRKELGRTLARKARIPKAIAQDCVDSVVHDILKKLKAGRPVALPGVGKLVISPTTKRTQPEPRA